LGYTRAHNGVDYAAAVGYGGLFPWSEKDHVEGIYNEAAPVPGGTPDPQANAFLREIRILMRDAIREGRGKLVVWPSHDRSLNYVARDYAYNLLNSLEPNALRSFS
jgi:hypothetical protein